jgi:hypothetical protein
MAKTKAELLQTLKDLVEGKIDEEAWMAWWKPNAAAVKTAFGEKLAEKLKPKSEQLPAEAAFNSQNQAMTILNEAHIPAKRSMCYFERYVKSSDALEASKGKEFKSRINLLKAKYPKLTACLSRNAKKIETFAAGASEKEVAAAEKTLKAKLPRSMRDFFKVTKHFGAEGLEIDLDQLFIHPGDRNAADGKRYLCVGDYFWKADGDQVLVDVSAPAVDPKIFYYAHSEPGAKILPLAENWKEFLENLPKQYLNQTFYYS